MILSRVEVINSVERRRRWSREEKERLIAASFEPGISSSEIARAAGIHVSQLFRWRKDLCDRIAPTAAQLLPVVLEPEPPLSPSRKQGRPPGDVDRHAGAASAASLRSSWSVESASVSTATSMSRFCAGFWMCWVRDDPGSERRASVTGDRPYRYEEGLRRLGAGGAGDAEARSPWRSSLRLSRAARRSDQGRLA